MQPERAAALGGQGRGACGEASDARRDGAGGLLPELLAPAGTLDALLAAVAAGADAVYAGLGDFNARATAENLSPEDLARGAALAHARGVRVYVPLNVTVADCDLARALAAAGTALGCGADALIVSDWGLAAALAEAYPGVELHLSTQANVHAAPGVLLAARELGFSRVTTSRELSLDEIAGLAATGVDVEVFCHGAICVCYSGACELSERLRGRSALRGLCAQPCRLPYELVDGAGEGAAVVEGDRLLCPRDYLSIGRLPELVRAGVASLKIEGRMKNPDYVHGVVRVYRRALDAIAEGSPYDADGYRFELGCLFNRLFTDGYLAGRVDEGLMSYERSCNQGVYVGRLVERVERGEYEVELERPVGAGDVLEVRSCPDQHARVVRPKRWSMVEAPAPAAAGERLRVHIKRKVELGSDVHLVRSVRMLQEAEEGVERLRAELADSTGAVSPVRPVVDAARATAAAAAAAPRQAGGSAASASSHRGAVLIAGSPALARRALDEGCGAGIDAVCVRAERVAGDRGLWEGLLPRMGVLLGEACHDGELEDACGLMRRASFVVCRNLSEVALARELGVPFEVASPLAVCNARAALVLAGLGARRVWLSPEAPAETDGACAELGIETCRVVWGHPQLMVTEVCLLRAAGACDGDHERCARRETDWFLRCGDGRELLVRVDGRGRSRLFDTVPACGAIAGGSHPVVDAELLGDEEGWRIAMEALEGAGAPIGDVPGPSTIGEGA